MFRIGGSEIQSYLYAKEFSKRGWRVIFLSPNKKEKRYKFDNKGIEVVLYNTSKIFIINWLIELWQFYRCGADVYYYRNNRYHLGLIRLVCKMNRARYIWAVMSDAFCSRDAAVKKAVLDIKKYKGFLKFIFIAKLKIESRLFRAGVKNSDLIIVQNSRQKQIVKKEFGQKSVKIYNSHPLGIYAKKRENNILYIGSLKSIKRPKLFCKLAQSLNKRDYNFIMIGGIRYQGTEKDEMLEIIKQSNVDYIGEQDLDEVNSILSTSKLYINTSEVEGFPNTFIQSWSYGVPVLSFKVNPDGLLTDKKLGKVCNDNIDLAKMIIEELMDNKKIWKSLSERCYNYSKEQFNIVKSVDKIEEALATVL